MDTPICTGTDLVWECCMSMFTAEEYYQGLEDARRDDIEKGNRRV